MPYFIGIILILSLGGGYIASLEKNFCDSEIRSDVGKRAVSVNTYDSNGNIIKIYFDDVPQRIITNQEGILYTLMALGLGNHIAAASVSNPYMEPIDFASPYWVEQKIPEIQRYEFDRETVLALRPNIIVGWKSTFSRSALGCTSFWNERGIATYITASSNRIKNNATIDDECNFILDMGKIFGKEEKAEAIVQKIHMILNDGQAVLRGKKLDAPKVLVLQYNNANNIFAYERSWLIGDIIEKLGGHMLQGTSHVIGKEEVIALNPDIIFVMCTGKGDREKYEQYVLKDPAFESIKAVQSRRVYGIPFSSVYAPGVKIIDGIQLIQKCLF